MPLGTPSPVSSGATSNSQALQALAGKGGGAGLGANTGAFGSPAAGKMGTGFGSPGAAGEVFGSPGATGNTSSPVTNAQVAQAASTYGINNSSGAFL